MKYVFAFIIAFLFAKTKGSNLFLAVDHDEFKKKRTLVDKQKCMIKLQNPNVNITSLVISANTKLKVKFFHESFYLTCANMLIC